LSLQGYLPANIDRREETLQRKRQEYQNFIDRYYHTRDDPQHTSTFRQVGGRVWFVRVPCMTVGGDSWRFGSGNGKKV
jgi:hypothetical protein